MDTSDYYRSVVDFYYKNPRQYMSPTDIVKYETKTNTWNITHTLKIQHVQVVA